MGFSGQEYWSGLPFPSPMHESESEVTHRVRLLATPWTVAYEFPPSVGFPRQEYWSGVPLPSPSLRFRHHLLQWGATPFNTQILSEVQT